MNVTYVAHFNDTTLSNETKETLFNQTVFKNKWNNATLQLNTTGNLTVSYRSVPVVDEKSRSMI